MCVCVCVCVFVRCAAGATEQAPPGRLGLQRVGQRWCGVEAKDFGVHSSILKTSCTCFFFFFLLTLGRVASNGGTIGRGVELSPILFSLLNQFLASRRQEGAAVRRYEPVQLHLPGCTPLGAATVGHTTRGTPPAARAATA